MALGTIVSGRDHSELENVLGFFVNTLVLRAQVRPELTVAEFLSDVRRTVLDAFSHQNLPYDRLIEELRPDRDPSRTPLIQAALLLKRAQGPGPEGLRIEEFGLPRLNALFDLGFEFEERNGTLAGLIEYSTALFDKETIARLARHLVVLLEGMAADPRRTLGQLPLMDHEERRQVTTGWNDTDAAGRADRTTVHQLVAEQAARTPDAIAVATPQTRLTFAELDGRADRLARRLLENGVRPGAVVAVRTGRGAEMVTAQLAVLKAGAAYLPLDPELPHDRNDVHAPGRVRAAAADAARAGGRAGAGGHRSAVRRGRRPRPGRRGRGGRTGAGGGLLGRPRLCHLHLRLHRARQGRAYRAPWRGQPLRLVPGLLPHRPRRPGVADRRSGLRPDRAGGMGEPGVRRGGVLRAGRRAGRSARVRRLDGGGGHHRDAGAGPAAGLRYWTSPRCGTARSAMC